MIIILMKDVKRIFYNSAEVDVSVCLLLLCGSYTQHAVGM